MSGQATDDKIRKVEAIPSHNRGPWHRELHATALR